MTPRKNKRPLALMAMLALLPLLLITAPATAEETVDSILAKYYEALGGTEAWSKIKNVRASGIMTMMGIEAPITVVSAEPNKMRIEFEIQGMKGIQAFDGTSGWQVMPFQTGSDKPEPIPKDQADDMSATAGVAGPLFDYEAKGNKVELVGREDVEGTETYHLQITLKEGKVMDWYLDAEYYIPIQQKFTISIQGQEMESITTLSDYKEVGGLMVPFTTTQKLPMGEQVLTMSSFEPNVDLDEDFFTMPIAEEDSTEEE